MAYKTLLKSEQIAQYVNDVVTIESPIHKRLRAETAKMPMGGMQVSADQGALLGFFVKLIGAKRALEVGTFTGYSALCIASALPADGKLICCDISDEWTRIGRPYWREAGVESKIDLRIGPAVETLAKMTASDAGKIDIAFVDADKESYDAYYEAAMKLLRPGGMMVFDNVLRGGKVADPDAHDTSTDAIRTLNAKMRDDPRVDATILTVGDGFMLARKK
jgi:predicted O-methyltransferase YrrM